jgi:predicted Rossmann-fold nucleotide-binding protein
MTQLQLSSGTTQLPSWETPTGTKFCTPLHARANEAGRLFDVGPNNAIVCTGGQNGSMSKSLAVAHDLRTIRDRFCAPSQ